MNKVLNCKVPPVVNIVLNCVLHAVVNKVLNCHLPAVANIVLYFQLCAVLNIVLNCQWHVLVHSVELSLAFCCEHSNELPGSLTVKQPGEYLNFTAWFIKAEYYLNRKNKIMK